MLIKILEKYLELKKLLNKLVGKIIDDEMCKMNYEVNVNGKLVYIVVKDYLKD